MGEPKNALTVVCVFVHLGFGLVLKQGLPYVVLVSLQLTVDRAGSLCLPSAKIKAVHHHNWLNVFSVVSYYSVVCCENKKDQDSDHWDMG